MEEARLNWADAEVVGGDLKVPLEGDAPAAWKKTFKTTIKLLGGGDWGDIDVKKAEVRVSGVVAGSEATLRHHLEAIVQQANAQQRPAPKTARKKQDPTATGEGRDDADVEMTRRFREFAAGASSDEESGNPSD